MPRLPQKRKAVLQSHGRVPAGAQGCSATMRRAEDRACTPGEPACTSATVQAPEELPVQAASGAAPAVGRVRLQQRRRATLGSQ